MFKLGRIDEDNGLLGGGLDGQRHALTDGAPESQRAFLHHLVKIDQAAVRRLLTGELE